MCPRTAVIAILAGVPLIAQQAPRPVQSDVNFYSPEKEAALGRQLTEDFRQRSTPIDSAIVQDYVDRLGQRLAGHALEATLPFTFSVVVDDPSRATHEPVAFPGGYVFVPAALVVAANDESEFAGMLAHAMEHIAQHHGIRQLRAQPVNTGHTPLIFMGGWAGGSPDGLAVPLGFLTSMRSNEREADVLAVQLMAQSGFDPEALVRYIERVQPPVGNTAKAFSVLPDRDQRVAGIRHAIGNLPPSNYAAPGEEFLAVQREVQDLMERRSVPAVPPTLKRKDLK
jgi:predicted Zn-dependent protease